MNAHRLPNRPTISGACAALILALALAAGADRASAATIANAAAGVVVAKRGTARLTVEELTGALFRSLGAGHRDAVLDAAGQGDDVAGL